MADTPRSDYLGAKLWNGMPQDMRSAASLNYLKVNTDMNWRKLQACILLNTDFKIDIINDMLHVLFCMDLYNDSVFLLI